MTARTQSDVASTATAPKSPSHPLLAAALAGLLGVAGCDSDEGAEPRILSSVVDPDVTQESFETRCTEHGGRLELHSHCGGANSCAGFSYDTDTQVFTEHTCQGMNTCSGFSCVLPREG